MTKTETIVYSANGEAYTVEHRGTIESLYHAIESARVKNDDETILNPLLNAVENDDDAAIYEAYRKVDSSVTLNTADDVETLVTKADKAFYGWFDTEMEFFESFMRDNTSDFDLWMKALGNKDEIADGTAERLGFVKVGELYFRNYSARA